MVHNQDYITSDLDNFQSVTAPTLTNSSLQPTAVKVNTPPAMFCGHVPVFMSLSYLQLYYCCQILQPRCKCIVW